MTMKKLPLLLLLLSACAFDVDVDIDCDIPLDGLFDTDGRPNIDIDDFLPGETGTLYPGTCGWGDLEGFGEAFVCWGDPTISVGIECPTPLTEGEACGDVTAVGCCDGNGDVWYCGKDDEGLPVLVREFCIP